MTTHELAVYEREGAAGLAKLADRQLEAKKKHDKRVHVKAAPRVAAKATKRQTKATTWKAIKAAVYERAQGQCEAWGIAGYGDKGPIWGRCSNRPMTVDHWLGGSGRRVAMQSVDSCWALCFSCDWNRTHNSPSARHWNEANLHHCRANGLPHTPHVINEAEAA
jgi:hypothetical protein